MCITCRPQRPACERGRLEDLVNMLRDKIRSLTRTGRHEDAYWLSNNRDALIRLIERSK